MLGQGGVYLSWLKPLCETALGVFRRGFVVGGRGNFR